MNFCWRVLSYYLMARVYLFEYYVEYSDFRLVLWISQEQCAVNPFYVVLKRVHPGVNFFIIQPQRSICRISMRIYKLEKLKFMSSTPTPCNSWRTSWSREVELSMLDPGLDTWLLVWEWCWGTRELPLELIIFRSFGHWLWRISWVINLSWLIVDGSN